MIRWLNKISSFSSPDSSSNNARSSAPSAQKWNAAFASDPSEWERIFDVKWAIVEAILEKKLNDVEHDVSYEEMTILLENTTYMNSLLMLEVNSQPEPAIGPILDRYFTQQIFERILDWAIQLPQPLKPPCQLSLIRMYESIVGESHTQSHCLLVHKPVLNPLLRLCECKRADVLGYKDSARRSEPSSTEKHFVLLLNQICTKLAEDRTLLHFFFHAVNGAEQFIVFTMLIPFLYEQNDVGQLARDALLLILSVSSEHSGIAQFVACKTDFCPVVATGLSGCFSQLDRTLVGDGGERSVDDLKTDALLDFHSSLLFCNAVTQAAHARVVAQICDFFYSGFLLSVVKPVLMQDDREWIAACLSYLQMCVEVISDPSLLRTVFRLLLIERDDSGTVLIARIIQFSSFKDKAAVVSLSLLETILQLCCEDFMLAAVFHPLLLKRVRNKKNLAKATYNRNRCVGVSEKILNAIPNCILAFKEICSQETLALYMREAQTRLEARAEQCGSWKCRYDTIPDYYLPADSDDDSSSIALSARSSSRSTTSLAFNGLNRYFHAAKTSDFSPVGALGNFERDDSLELNDLELEEDDSFILPPLNGSLLMTSSMVDYLQLTSLDDLSESDDPLTNVKEFTSTVEPETPSGMSKSFILSGWQNIEDKDILMSLLEKRAPAKLLSSGELCSFIDLKLKSLRQEDENKCPDNIQSYAPVNKQTTTGFPLGNFTEDFLLLSTVMQSLESLCENSLPFNIELCNLLAALVSYPQPILAHFLFDTKGEKAKNLLVILDNLKTRIDCMAEGVEGFDVWVGRALRTLEMRAARIQRHHQYNAKADAVGDDYALSTLFWGRNFGGSGRHFASYRLHSHKWVESVETQRDDATAKQTAHAAIFAANLCQMLAAVVLQQSLIV